MHKDLFWGAEENIWELKDMVALAGDLCSVTRTHVRGIWKLLLTSLSTCTYKAYTQTYKSRIYMYILKYLDFKKVNLTYYFYYNRKYSVFINRPLKV